MLPATLILALVLQNVPAVTQPQSPLPTVRISDTSPPFDRTADTVFDIIRTSDPTTFSSLTFAGREQHQIWDKRIDGEPVVNAYVFMARFSDGVTVKVAVNPEFGSEPAANAEAMRFAIPLGQLPAVLRKGIGRFSIHAGDQGFHAGTGQIVVYAETATQRMSNNHLEESIFHEAIHASWDDRYRLAPDWVSAQKADGRFLTGYAASKPEREDLAETALFAYGMLRRPGRIPPADTQAIAETVPNRLKFLGRILPGVDG